MPVPALGDDVAMQTRELEHYFGATLDADQTASDTAVKRSSVLSKTALNPEDSLILDAVFSAYYGSPRASNSAISLCALDLFCPAFLARR